MAWSHSYPNTKTGEKQTSHRKLQTHLVDKLSLQTAQKRVNKRLVWYLEKYKIITEHQSGFRQHRSTTASLIYLESNICETFINNEHLAAVSMDIEKAYDMVRRQRIIKKLIHHNIDVTIRKFIINFLEKRYISVRVNGHLSERVEISNGVPQGSVKSVTLFLIAKRSQN